MLVVCDVPLFDGAELPLQVSHDEHLITAVCDELWIIRDRKVHLSDVCSATR